MFIERRVWPYAALLLLALTQVRSQSPSPAPDAFSYTNIRLETSTPVDHYNNVLGNNPSTVVASPSPGTSNPPLLDRSTDVSGVASSAGVSGVASSAGVSGTSNPFTNVETVDLSTFSKEDLEARRDLLLAILDQTNEELVEESPSPSPKPSPSPSPANPFENVASNATRLSPTGEEASTAVNQDYIPQKQTRQSSFFNRIMGEQAAPASAGISSFASSTFSLIAAAGLSCAFLFV